MAKVFEVQYRCANCGHVWKEKYEKGDRITEDFWGVHLHSHQCTGDYSCPHCKRIECPVCGATKAISVKARQPLGYVDLRAKNR